MTNSKLALMGSVVGACVATAAVAECGIASGSVRILSNDFPAPRTVSDGAKACASDTVEVTVNQTADHREIQVAALTANPAQYTTAVVANSSIVPLINDDLIRPLDDLVAEFGAGLADSQLITIDGKVMAVAFMANAQHLYYRADILERAGVEPPQTYEDVVAAAEAIRAAGIVDNPFAFNSKVGWNLGEEFVNMYSGMGASFFKPGTAEPSFNNEAGVKILEMLKALTEVATPGYLTLDSTATTALWESGELALATLWGSQGAAILDGEGATRRSLRARTLSARPPAAAAILPPRPCGGTASRLPGTSPTKMPRRLSGRR